MITEREFWNWFEKNEAQFYFLNQVNNEDEREKILDYFLSNLHKYCNRLFFEIGGYPDEKQDLIITAEGDTSVFQKVEDLVKQAPHFDNWNIIAFKPQKPELSLAKFNNVTLNPDAMYFIPLHSKNSEKIGLRIYTENYTSNYNEDFLTASYITLDNILGEKSNALNIGYVEIKCLPSISERDDLIEFSKLPRYIKWKKSQN